MFHRHRMVEHARTYAPPFGGRVTYVLSQPTLIKIMQGTTTVIFKCSKEGCSKTKVIEVLGKEVTVDELEKQYRSS